MSLAHRQPLAIREEAPPYLVDGNGTHAAPERLPKGLRELLDTAAAALEMPLEDAEDLLRAIGQLQEQIQALREGKPLGPVLGAQTILNQGTRIEQLEAALPRIWAHGYERGHSAGISCGHPLAGACQHSGTEAVGDFAEEIAELASLTLTAAQIERVMQDFPHDAHLAGLRASLKAALRASQKASERHNHD
mgnify:CR=1 FL=1